MRPLFCLRPCLLDRNKPHFVCRTKITLDCVGAQRASQCTQRRDQLCQTDAAFSCPLLKTGLWECFPSERVNVWAWRGSVCAGNQKFFSTTACSWAFIGSRQGYQLPRLTNPFEGTVGNRVQPSPGLWTDKLSLYQRFDFSCSHRSHLQVSSLTKGVNGRDATSNWPISISQCSAGCLKTGPSEGPSGTREARQFII